AGRHGEHRLCADQYEGGLAAEGNPHRADGPDSHPRRNAQVEQAFRGYDTEGSRKTMNATVAAPQKEPRPFREVWLITMGHGLTHWYPSTFYLLLPIIGRELSLSYSEIGLIMTCQYIAGAIANVPGGIITDTVGRKGVLMALSLFWVGFPYLLMGFSHGYLMLLGCVMLVGFGNSLWHPTAIPTLARLFPERKGLVLSLHGMGGN